MFSDQDTRTLEVNRFAVYISIDAVAPCVIIERLYQYTAIADTHYRVCPDVCNVSIGMRGGGRGGCSGWSEVGSASDAIGKSMHLDLDTSETKHLSWRWWALAAQQ